MGINLGPLLGQVAFYRPDIIITALTGTTMIFISFSAAALLAQRRHFLYLGGVLGSAISILFSLRSSRFPLSRLFLVGPIFLRSQFCRHCPMRESGSRVLFLGEH